MGLVELHQKVTNIISSIVHQATFVGQLGRLFLNRAVVGQPAAMHDP